MSLDIGEIGVRVNVRDTQDKQDKAGDKAGDGCCAAAPAQGLAPAERADMVRQCVRQVLEALRMDGAR